MFEVGFTEMLVILGLALIVLGPEKLPRVASQVGRWMGRARSMARQFREQLEEEANLEEMVSPKRKAKPKPKFYQPDDDTQRTDVSHADAGAEPEPTAAPTPDEPPRDEPGHERGI